MPWHPIWPVITDSVKTNGPTGQENTVYVKDTMGGVPLATNLPGTEDHFWDVAAGLNGHHRFVKLPDYNAQPDFDPTFIQNVIYARLKSAVESVAQQDAQPFVVNRANNVNHVMQLLGIRAMGVFNGSGGTPPQGSVVYSHNLALQTAGTPGIVRTNTGRYTVTFSASLPSVNYLILGGALRSDSSSELLFAVTGANGGGLAAVKTTTSFQFRLITGSGTFHDPLQAWFVVFGG